MIIDCDLRKPGLHRVFNRSNRLGVSNLLTGSATLEEITRETEIPWIGWPIDLPGVNAQERTLEKWSL